MKRLWAGFRLISGDRLPPAGRVIPQVSRAVHATFGGLGSAHEALLLSAALGASNLLGGAVELAAVGAA